MAVLCLGEYGNCIPEHGHSVVTSLNSANRDHISNIRHKNYNLDIVRHLTKLYTRPRVMIILFCWLAVLKHAS
jgi:hypothetical protein